MNSVYRTRGYVVPLDPTPAQDQLLRSYCGASRFAYNWTLSVVKENLDKRNNERETGAIESELTKSLSWSQWSMTPLWNSVKDEVAPWHHNVTKHAFRSGVTNAAIALKNYHESKNGVRRGGHTGFPQFKNRHSRLSVTFVDIRLQGGWFTTDSRHVRLVLPRHPTDSGVARRREQLQWIHSSESFCRLKKKVASGASTIQAVTISFTGGRWQASFSVRTVARREPSSPVVNASSSAVPAVSVSIGT